MESSRHIFPTGNLKCTHEFILYQGTTTMHGHVMSSHSYEASQIQKQQNHFFCIQNTQNNKKCQESVTIFSPPLLRLRSLVFGLSYQASVMGPPSILIATWVQGFDLDRTSFVSFLLTLSIGGLMYLEVVKIDFLILDVKFVLININYVEFFSFFRNFIDKSLTNFFIFVVIN